MSCRIACSQLIVMLASKHIWFLICRHQCERAHLLFDPFQWSLCRPRVYAVVQCSARSGDCRKHMWFKRNVGNTQTIRTPTNQYQAVSTLEIPSRLQVATAAISMTVSKYGSSIAQPLFGAKRSSPWKMWRSGLHQHSICTARVKGCIQTVNSAQAAHGQMKCGADAATHVAGSMQPKTYSQLAVDMRGGPGDMEGGRLPIYPNAPVATDSPHEAKVGKWGQGNRPIKCAINSSATDHPNRWWRIGCCSCTGRQYLFIPRPRPW